MNKYIILGVGIGILITNFLYSIMPSKEVDINKLVDAEVQKRIKKIDEMKEIENTFQEVVEKTTIATTEAITVQEDSAKRYSKDESPEAEFYIYVDRLKEEKDVERVKGKIENLIDLDIKEGSRYTYIFSEYPYTAENSDEIIKILNEEYKIKAIKIKEKQKTSLISKAKVR